VHLCIEALEHSHSASVCKQGHNLQEHIEDAGEAVCCAQVVFVMPGIHQGVAPALLL